jgi:predicted transcriptional regulator
MIAIQISFDEELLERLDSTNEVKARGRSAVFRQAIAEFLERKRRQDVADQYAHAYAGGAGPGDEFAGWEDQGEWPES